MNKKDKIAEVARRTGMTQTQTNLLVDVFLAVTFEELAAEGESYLPAIGRLIVRDRSARLGRNPQTGASMEFPPSRSVGFKVSRVLKDRLNNEKRGDKS